MCKDDSYDKELKYIDLKCNNCDTKNRMSVEIVEHYKNIYEITGNSNIQHFKCTNCDGELRPTNPMEL